MAKPTAKRERPDAGDLVLAGRTPAEAAAELGADLVRVRAALARPEAVAELRRRRAERRAAVRDVLEAAALDLARDLVALARDPATPAAVRVRAIDALLTRAVGADAEAVASYAAPDLAALEGAEVVGERVRDLVTADADARRLAGLFGPTWEPSGAGAAAAR